VRKRRRRMAVVRRDCIDDEFDFSTTTLLS
jgi:hypothetical protein